MKVPPMGAQGYPRFPLPDDRTGQNISMLAKPASIAICQMKVPPMGAQGYPRFPLPDDRTGQNISMLAKPAGIRA